MERYKLFDIHQIVVDQGQICDFWISLSSAQMIVPEQHKLKRLSNFWNVLGSNSAVYINEVKWNVLFISSFANA